MLLCSGMPGNWIDNTTDYLGLFVCEIEIGFEVLRMAVFIVLSCLPSPVYSLPVAIVQFFALPLLVCRRM